MGQKIHRASDGQYVFHCPGCKCGHGVYVDASGHPVWGWNGSIEKPTFSPSILIHSTAMTENGRRDYEAWKAAGFPERSQEFETRPSCCHSFVRDGQIQFLGDCTHELMGKTVEIPDWDD